MRFKIGDAINRALYNEWYMKKLSQKIIVLLLMGVFLLPGFAFAQSKALQGDIFKNTLGKSGAGVVDKVTSGATVQKTVTKQIGFVIKNLLSFLGILLLVVIIYAGVMWLTAGGNSEKSQKATKILTDAFLGALVVGTAYLITSFALTIGSGV